MSTLRCRLPIMLSDLIAHKVEISFDYHIGEPVMNWKTPKGKTGHYHLDGFVNGEHGYNSLLIEGALGQIYDELLGIDDE